ncbi:sulfotransferase family 2 domain-containing protein [Lutibacter aestuarii]|uniref:Sulfotransferase family 2 domain-containing protein n=1 Tax=Lutibacter aestuarii TaxID=861111 RepID=A0ABW2Z5N7_9FLAO
MIDHRNKVIFIHIPKNAGTSIERTVFNNFDFNLKYSKEYLFGFDNELGINLQHLTLNQMIRFKFITKELLSDYNSFAVVRNPFSRAISGYIWLMKDLQINDTFTNFLLRKGEFTPLKLKKTLRYVEDHFYTQSHFIKLKDEIKIKNILRFETLEKDIKEYNSNYQLKHHFKKNKKAKIKLVKFFTNRNIKLINEIYKEDFENFNYSKKFNAIKYILGYV